VAVEVAAVSPNKEIQFTLEDPLQRPAPPSFLQATFRKRLVVVVSGRVLACLVCGASLEGLRRDARYCSGKCRTAALRTRRDGSEVPGDGSERMEVS
jgi:hypothetical protein